MKYDFTLYGSDTDLQLSTPTKAAVEALPDVKIWTPDVLTAHYTSGLDSEGQEYLDGIMDSDTIIRSKWTIRVKAKQFPQNVAVYTDATSILDYYPFLDVMSKQFQYIFFGNKYPLQPSSIIASAAEVCLPIAVKSVGNEEMEGLKTTTFEIWSRESGIY